MTETEKRRKELLNQTRNLYHDVSALPAIHPRYGASYQKLYNKDEYSEKGISSFKTRLILSLLFFIVFAAMDYGDLSFLQYESEEIVDAVSMDLINDDLDIDFYISHLPF